jgi:hypothetical protein
LHFDHKIFLPTLGPCFEDQLALTDEFNAKIERGEQDLRQVRSRIRKP